MRAGAIYGQTAQGQADSAAVYHRLAEIDVDDSRAEDAVANAQRAVDLGAPALALTPARAARLPPGSVAN